MSEGTYEYTYEVDGLTIDASRARADIHIVVTRDDEVDGVVELLDGLFELEPTINEVMLHTLGEQKCRLRIVLEPDP